MFALSGQKWGGPANGSASGPVYWSANYIDALEYNQGLWVESEFDEALEDAFQAWEDVAGIDFEMADGDNAADITVETAPLAGSTVGLASYSFQPRVGVDRFVSARIDFDENESWSPEGQDGTLSFYAVALHEIGHVIGLDHVNDPTEILNPTIVVDELGDGDIAGALIIYGPPAAAEAPAPDLDGGVPGETFDEPPAPEPEIAPEPTAEDEEPAPELPEGDETDTAATGDSGSSAAAGVMGLMGVGLMVLVGGPVGLVAGGVVALLGLAAGSSSAGGVATTSAAGRDVNTTNIVDDDVSDDDFFASLPVIEFSITGMGCPGCGDDACGSCTLDDGEAAVDATL